MERMYSGKNIVCAVITAAGKGARMGMDRNKQFLDILGKPMLARTLQAFEDCAAIDEIIVTAEESEIEFCKDNIVAKYGFRKVRAVVAGGASRQQSVYNGLKQVRGDCGIVLIHDGARPFIDRTYIEACTAAASETGAAVAAAPVKDTIKRSGASGFIEETLDRDGLWSIQTPQAFRYQLIMEAHRKAAEEGFVGTDDAVLVERLNQKVQIVPCSYFNIKITTREDLVFAEAICKMKEFRI
jgi:2-C-methyl-D-erythritol 4-phosphate cytidylyltransferase